MKNTITKIRLIVVVLVFFQTTVSAQKMLSYQDAVALALAKNHDIILQKNNVAMADNLNTGGNSGMLPTVDATGTYNKSTRNIEQNLSSGLTINSNNVQSSELNGAINLNWTLFDGFGMFVRKRQLETNVQFNEQLLKQQVQTTIENLTSTYLNAVLKRQQIKFVNELISILENQKKIADAKYSAGITSKQDVLYVNIELNNQRAELIKRENEYRALRRQLVTLTGSDEGGFDTEESPEFMQRFAAEKSGVETNPQLQMANTSITSLLLKQKEFNAALYPKIDLFSSYTLSQNESQAGFLLLNRSLGLNYGARVSVPLFNGFVARTARKNVMLEYASSKTRYDQIKLALNTEFQQLTEENKMLEQLLKLQQSNEKDADENFFIANQRYEKGVISVIELKEAQRLLETTKYSILESQNTFYLNKVRMMALTGELVGGK